jgi:hypothetical protein
MHESRAGFTATLLSDGRIFVVGGYLPLSDVAEIFEPGAKRWTKTRNISVGRIDHESVLLADGRVMVCGGYRFPDVTNLCEVYSPVTDQWTEAASMTFPRRSFSLVRLDSGEVLAVGGYDSEGQKRPYANAELYSPTANAWTTVGAISQPRSDTRAVKLAGGKVLVIGGRRPGTDEAFGTVDLFNPETRLFTAFPGLNVARRDFGVALLGDGSVLVAGGGGVGGSLKSAERYDGTRWVVVADQNVSHFGSTLTALADGKALCVGGIDSFANGVSEVYEPAANRWTQVATLKSSRYFHRAVTLNDGRVMVIGGQNRDEQTLSSTEFLVSTATVDSGVGDAGTTLDGGTSDAGAKRDGGVADGGTSSDAGSLDADVVTSPETSAVSFGSRGCNSTSLLSVMLALVLLRARRR